METSIAYKTHGKDLSESAEIERFVRSQKSASALQSLSTLSNLIYLSKGACHAN